MATWHFLKQLTCTFGAHSTAISRPLTRASPSSLPVSSPLHFLFNHRHKASHHWPSHNIPIEFKIHTAVASSTALAHKSSAPYISVLIQCPKDNAVITLLFSFFLSSLVIVAQFFYLNFSLCSQGCAWRSSFVLWCNFC